MADQCGDRTFSSPKTVRSMSNDSGVNASADLSINLEETAFNNSISTIDHNTFIDHNSTIDFNSQLLNDSQCCDRSEFVDSGIGESEGFSQSFEQDLSVCDDLTQQNELLIPTQSDFNSLNNPPIEKLENQFHSKELEEIRAMNERVSN